MQRFLGCRSSRWRDCLVGLICVGCSNRRRQAPWPPSRHAESSTRERRPRRETERWCRRRRMPDDVTKPSTAGAERHAERRIGRHRADRAATMTPRPQQSAAGRRRIVCRHSGRGTARAGRSRTLARRSQEQRGARFRIAARACRPARARWSAWTRIRSPGPRSSWVASFISIRGCRPTARSVARRATRRTRVLPGTRNLASASADRLAAAIRRPATTAFSAERSSGTAGPNRSKIRRSVRSPIRSKWATRTRSAWRRSKRAPSIRRNSKSSSAS